MAPPGPAEETLLLLGLNLVGHALRVGGRPYVALLGTATFILVLMFVPWAFLFNQLQTQVRNSARLNVFPHQHCQP